MRIRSAGSFATGRICTMRWRAGCSPTSATISAPNPAGRTCCGRAGRGMRQVLLAHRDGARLAAGAQRLSPDVDAAAHELLGPLVRAGFTSDRAREAILTIDRFAIGWCLDEASMLCRGTASPKPSRDTEFEFGLEVLIAGARRGRPAGAAERASHPAADRDDGDLGLAAACPAKRRRRLSGALRSHRAGTAAADGVVARHGQPVGRPDRRLRARQGAGEPGGAPPRRGGPTATGQGARAFGADPARRRARRRVRRDRPCPQRGDHQRRRSGRVRRLFGADHRDDQKRDQIARAGAGAGIARARGTGGGGYRADPAAGSGGDGDPPALDPLFLYAAQRRADDPAACRHLQFRMAGAIPPSPNWGRRRRRR